MMYINGRLVAVDPIGILPDIPDADSTVAGDLDLDSTVLFRYRVEKPGWKPAWDSKPDIDNTCTFAPLPGSCRTAGGRRP